MMHEPVSEYSCMHVMYEYVMCVCTNVIMHPLHLYVVVSRKAMICDM